MTPVTVLKKIQQAQAVTRLAVQRPTLVDFVARWAAAAIPSFALVGFAFRWLRIYDSSETSAASIALIVVPAMLAAIGAGLARRLLAAAITVAAAAFAANVALPRADAPAAEGSSPAVPHVILITLDTFRADALDPAAEGETPHLAGLAADGVRFSDAFSAAPWTKPAVASLMTGVLPLTHDTILVSVM